LAEQQGVDPLDLVSAPKRCQLLIPVLNGRARPIRGIWHRSPPLVVFGLYLDERQPVIDSKVGGYSRDYAVGQNEATLNCPRSEA
jgi:hypothetical protein